MTGRCVRVTLLFALRGVARGAGGAARRSPKSPPSVEMRSKVVTEGSKVRFRVHSFDDAQSYFMNYRLSELRARSITEGYKVRF